VRAATFVDSVLFVGGENGRVSGWSSLTPEQPLITFGLGADVWAGAFAEELNFLAFALGDGRLACFEPSFESKDIEGVRDARKYFRNHPMKPLASVLNRSRLVDPFVENMLDRIADPSDCSEDEIAELHKRMAMLDPRRHSDAHRLIEAAILVRGRKYLDARQKLQDIDQGSHWYPLSVIALAESIMLGGDRAGAMRVLAANKGMLKHHLGSPRLLSLQSGQPAGLDDFLNEREDETFTGKSLVLFSNKKVKRRSSAKVDYGIINYVKYEYPSNADAAKKILEHAQVTTVISELIPNWSGGLKSLDIGCATCRYPLWFASQGFIATGYDIDTTAIDICKRRSAGKPNIRIEQKNVLDSEAEPDSYHVITCMMGTFNHFSVAQQRRFLEWCNASLRSGGFLIFSAWNRDCPYTTMLHFYNRDAREALQKNMQSREQIARNLVSSQFILERALPTVFLPNDCYEAWMGRFDEDVIRKIDRDLQLALSPNEGQMLVFAARKP
jgi:2-polyprenyl-3-methyl-5-hydroxy-6-metoxy-1,4-benzoquinol methylase